MLVSWAGQDGAGSGVANYTVEVSRANDGAGASQDDWKTLLEKTGRTACTSAATRATPTGSASPRPTARSTRTTIVTDPVLIPVDDRDRGLFRLSRGWKRVRAEQAWGRTVVRAAQAGATRTRSLPRHARSR